MATGGTGAGPEPLGRSAHGPWASPGQLNEVVDSRLIASAMEWAAENCGEGGAAANQTFNITNGDTAAWEGIYPTIAAHFGMEMGEPAEAVKTAAKRRAPGDPRPRPRRRARPGRPRCYR